MKFTCGFKARCREPAVWCVQLIGVGGTTVCPKHKAEAVAAHTNNGKVPDVWRDAYFEADNEQQALDLRFGDENSN